MSQVDDVLHGQRTLLRDDDFMYATINSQQGGAYSLFTSDSNVIRPGDSTTPSGSASAATFTPSAYSGIATGVGRMQNLPADSSLTLIPQNGQWTVETNNYSPQGFSKLYAVPASFTPYGTTYTQIVMGNFAGNGYRQAVLYYSCNGSPSKVAMRVVGVGPNAGPGDPDLTFYPEFVQTQAAGTSTPVVNAGTLTVGDFEGAGHDQIAVMLTDSNTVEIFDVDPKTFVITLSHSLQLNWNNQNVILSPVALAAGRFRNGVELVAVGQVPGSRPAKIQAVPVSITISTSGATKNVTLATQEPQTVASNIDFPLSTPTIYARIFADAAPMKTWSSQTQEQLVFAAFPFSTVGVVSFDANWNASTDTRLIDSEQPCYYGLATGSFDKHMQDPNTHLTVRDGSIQIAVLASDTDGCSVTRLEQQQDIRIYDFTPTQPPEQQPYKLSVQSQYKFDGYPKNVSATFAFGDLQGRSLTLGNPTIVRITGSIQPDLILGIPPMHADYIVPQDDDDKNCTTSPCLYNFTVFPSFLSSYSQLPFTTSFNFLDTDKSNSSTNTTTSYGIAVKQTAEVKFTAGEPLVDSTTVDIKNTLQYAHDNTVARSYNSYSGTSTSLSVTTSLADHLLYATRTHNVYYYPVIGKTACPAGQTGCANPTQLYYVFSVPDNVTYKSDDGTDLMWYNPVQEPGNIFSYPWDSSILQSQYSGTATTQTKATCFVSDTSKDTLKTSWSSGATSGQNVASSNKFSADLSTTVSTTAGVKDVESGTFSYGLDIAGNTSLQTINAATQVLDASIGITTSKPSFSTSSTYGFVPFVFGLNNGQPTYQDITNLYSGGASYTNLKTGPLVVAYTADPTTNSSCGGDNPTNWTRMYPFPDLALNHPDRYSYDKANRVVTLNKLDRTKSILNQPFFKMKGFFVHKPTDPTLEGPVLEQVAPGDPIELTVRIYNYSLVPIQSNDVIHVRFYGQKVCESTADNSCQDPQTGKPCVVGDVCGNPFQIDDVSVNGGLPAFSSGANPNWTLVKTDAFQSGQYANMHLVFWVLTWIEGPNGGMVGEMPAHGLTRNPANFTFSNMWSAPLEQFSNNIGLYGGPQPFYVEPVSSPGGTERPASGPLDYVRMVQPSTLILSRRTSLESVVKAREAAVGPVEMTYYDGNPVEKGVALGHQRIQHIEPYGVHAHRLFYTPESCGLHTFYAVSEVRGQSSMSDSITARVTVDTGYSLEKLSDATKVADLPRAVRTEAVKLIERAERAYEADSSRLAHQYLEAYEGLIRYGARNKPTTVTNDLISRAKLIIGCTPNGITGAQQIARSLP